MRRYPFISIVIPCRNEENFISKCLDSIINNNYPKNKIEVLVVDGMSEDHTRDIIKEYSLKYNYIKLILNYNKIIPSALNKGISQAMGDIIVRMDAHSEYPKDFITNGVQCFKLTNADVIGGPIITMPAADTLSAKAIAIITSHKFGVGNSKFRTTNRDGYVDTVPFGFYKKEIFKDVGLFDERLARNQDNELSSRIIKSGKKIYLTTKCTAIYYNQSKISGLIKQALITGMWNVLTVTINKQSFCWRHFIPFLFINYLLLTGILMFVVNWVNLLFISMIILYLFLSLMFSLEIFFKKNYPYFVILPILFFIYHCCYGMGTLWGILRLCSFNKSITKN
jgi:glycosyltransferase involved in cell wall biosynthesis